jgi:hypothetical protein
MDVVPVPPFGDFATAKRFHHLLLLHIARLKQRGDPVGLHQFLLGQAIGLHGPGSGGQGECAECRQPGPCRTALLIALLTRLPVPWTPGSLATALTATRLWPGSEREVIEKDRLEWGDPVQADPRHRAERTPQTGRWTVRTYERGALRDSRHVGGDEQLCDLLISHALAIVFPYGWKIDSGLAEAVDAGAGHAQSWWSAQAHLPYLGAWSQQGAWEAGPDNTDQPE